MNLRDRNCLHLLDLLAYTDAQLARLSTRQPIHAVFRSSLCNQRLAQICSSSERTPAPFKNRNATSSGIPYAQRLVPRCARFLMPHR